MGMRFLLPLVGLLAGGLQASGAEPPASATRPNVVFILADDLGWGDLACQGHPYAKTPNLDQLAKEGTRFLQFYATGVTCCPSRTGFMTGRLPATYRKYPATAGFGDRETITALLEKQGYATGHFGKWHIGPDETPGTYGIDAIAEGGSRKGADNRDAGVFDRAVAFISQNQDQPFYVNVWGHISHAPVNPSAKLVEGFGPLMVDEAKLPTSLQKKFAELREAGEDPVKHLQRYLAEVEAMDANVGRLLQKLDELGLREKTIVVFSSDQGPAPLPEDHKESDQAKEAIDIAYNAMGSAADFRGGKHQMYEGGVRIPFLLRWPGQVPAGRVNGESVLSGSDWLPTLCALTSTKPPVDLAGEDVSPAWKGQTFTRTKPLFWKVSNARAEVGVREGNWKLFFPTSKRSAVELYDIATDPVEKNNVAEQNPEVVAALSAKAKEWNATLPTEYEGTKEREN